jgi:hypothetical protein
MVSFFRCGMFDYLVELACFEKNNSSSTRGEGLFGDTDPIERKAANEFYFRLRENLKEWNSKFGVDKKGKITKFREGFEKVFDSNVDIGCRSLLI